MAQAETQSTNWLSIVKEVFPRWRGVAKIEALLCDPDTHSIKWRVNASGEEIPGTRRDLDAWFWQNYGRLLLVPDADGGGDRLVVDDRTNYVDVYLPDGHWEYAVRRADVERWDHFDESSNNIISDYDPIAEFEREKEERPRTRLHPTPAALPPAPQAAPADTEADHPPAALPISKPPKRVSTKEWITAETIRLKKNNEILPDASRYINHFARLLEKRMSKAANTNDQIRPVSWKHIKNHLVEWGLWPIGSIKIS